MKCVTKLLITIMMLLVLSVSIFADESVGEVQNSTFMINNLWILVSTILIFIMHLGFATLETGLTRSKNTVNIIFKNISIVAIGILTYAFVGFNLMYPGDMFAGKLFGFGGFGLNIPENGLTQNYNIGYTYWTDFIFQAMFAATAATIVSGAVAERVKLTGFLIFATVYVSVCYPIVGMWHWGGGFLAQKGFHDFAGSTIVHSVGGWGALAGILILGPRIGKYENGHAKAILGHNMPLAAIGVFLLWFGWYGFNGGSVLSADPKKVSYVFVSTTLSASAGIIGAMAATWIIQKKPDLSMVLNGCLAGLVGITAGANIISPINSVIIGLISGIIVVLAVIIVDRLRADDPVGAVSVHLICGIWGTLAVGIFSPEKSLAIQAMGVLLTFIFCFPFSYLVLLLIKKSIGIRVSKEEELRGLDISEHGMEAYSGFQIFLTQ